MLSDLDLAIVAAQAMRLAEDGAIEDLKKQGFDISVPTYYRHLGHISSETRTRAFEHAKNFLEDHIDTIDELSNIKKMMYQEAIKENDHLKKTLILAKITETMIPYISAYKEATKQIIIEEVKNKLDTEERPVDLSTFGV